VGEIMDYKGFLGSKVGWVPALRWIPAYSTRRFGLYLIAGLSLAAFVIPESLAYASLIIMDVKASRAIRQAEVGAARAMIERTQERFEIKPTYLAADTAYGSADTLNWIVNEKKIAPHIPVIDKSKREDGTFSREDFRFDQERNICICPASKVLTTTGHIGPDHATRYQASLLDCRACVLKPKCCPVRTAPNPVLGRIRSFYFFLASPYG
jgi:hypothetical protein